MSRATVLTSATNKGGGGKTTLQAVLAAEAAKAGAKVLVMDLDRNRALSSLLGVETRPTEGTGYRLVKDLPLEGDLRTLTWGDVSLDVIPMGVGFRNHYFERALDNEVEMSGVDRRDPDAVERLRFSRLTHHLEPLRKEYDYVFLDIQNDDGDLAMNALYASDHVLAPVTPDGVSTELAMTGLRHVWQIARDHRPDLHLGGLVLNRIDRAFLPRQRANTRNTLHPHLRDFLLEPTLRRAPGVLQAAFQEHVPPNLHPRAHHSAAKDGTTFATDTRHLWENVAERLCQQRANPTPWHTAFRAFAQAAETRNWQNLATSNETGARLPKPRNEETPIGAPAGA